jgi:Domain of unknown function (DUF1996)/Glycine rich protein
MEPEERDEVHLFVSRSRAGSSPERRARVGGASRWVCRIGAVATVLSAGAWFLSSAMADTSGLSCSGTTCTQTFDAKGDAPQTFTVPDGVESISVQAAGAAGDGLGANAGGETDATLAVTPGEQLTLIVGDQGAAGSGGYGDGGGGDGNGGGGGTFVSDANSLLIAAGGGGGSAGSSDGGAGAGVGQSAVDGGGSDTVTGGYGATPDGPGAGGSVFDPGCSCLLHAADGSGPATDTSPGAGGDGSGGGGGGGGYYGGGGGAQGGGGGGSGYADPAATSVLGTVGANSGAGFVTLSYAQKQAQSIVFTSTPPAAPVIGDTYVVGATGGASGNPVTFSIDSSGGTGACSLGSDGVTVSFAGVGSCVIDADQAGNDSYSAAPQEQQQLSVHARLTTTTVSCSPDPVRVLAVGGAQCTAMVTDTGSDGMAITPTGGVGFVITNPQGSRSSDSCLLSTSASDASNSCSVSYPVPGGSKIRTVKVLYGGDSVHHASHGSGLLTVMPPKVSNTFNTFKTKCSIAAEGQFDPIRFPGQSPAGHIHEFFGNTQIGPSSTGSSLQSGASTTCQDARDTADYWVPELFADGQPVPPTGVDVYYQRVDSLQLAAGDVCPLVVRCSGSTFESVVTPPTDLRLIAGNSAAVSAQSETVVKWACSDSTSVGILPPACSSPRYLIVHVIFPGCWDGGSDLEPNGMNNVVSMTIDSHGASCPKGYDFPIPKLELTIHYQFSPAEPSCSSTVTENCINYSLSEFANGQLVQGPIWTMHADWLNGWQTSFFLGTPDPNDFDQLIARCDNDADGTAACGVASTKPTGSAFVLFH